MKLLIIRHGDPDYANDTLTPRGWKEAAALKDRLVKLPIRDFYVSPLGRAQDTASLTLKALGKEATVLPWLEEFFRARVERPDLNGGKSHMWDWLPEDWMKEEIFFDKDRWYTHPFHAEGRAKEYYDWVVSGLDGLLASYGYVRDGNLYRCEKGNEDTIALVCHYGLTCVLLSHLLNISPMVLWHAVFSSPTGVTTVQTEERRKGIVSFRAVAIGDVSHLYAAGITPSLSGFFRECADPEKPGSTD